MNNKPSHTPLRVVLAAGSLLGFIGGWAILGNAYSTAGTGAATTSATTNVIQAAPTTVQSTNGTTFQLQTNSATTGSSRSPVPLTSQSSTQTRTSRLRTGGS